MNAELERGPLVARLGPILALAALAFACDGGVATEPESRVTLIAHGTVTDASTGAPLERVQVRLIYRTTPTVLDPIPQEILLRSTRTDAAGSYSVDNGGSTHVPVSGGNHYVWATSCGYEEAAQLIVLRGATMVRVDFDLIPRSEPAPPGSPLCPSGSPDRSLR